METRVREMQTPGRLTEAELAQLNPNDPTDAAIIMSHYYYEVLPLHLVRFNSFATASI